MSLSEIVSRCDLTAFPIAALVIFVPVFVVMTFRAIRPSRAEEFRRAARLPLEDMTPSITAHHGECE